MPRFDARALSDAGLPRDQIRMLESLFALSARLGVATDAYAITNTTPTRTLDADDAAGAISATPTQAEVTNIRDAVLVLADVVGTLIEDLKTKGVVT